MAKINENQKTLFLIVSIYQFNLSNMQDIPCYVHVFRNHDVGMQGRLHFFQETLDCSIEPINISRIIAN
jgi:hypothetical protein